MSCVACGTDSVVEIKMKVNGSDVSFRRCARCDANDWVTGEDRHVPLSTVLELARQS